MVVEQFKTPVNDGSWFCIKVRHWNKVLKDAPKNTSLRHVALAVNKLEECEAFYNLLGMQTELKTTDYVYSRRLNAGP